MSVASDEAMQKVIEKFRTGDLSPVIEVIRIRQDPNDNMPSSHWSLSNQLMTYLQTGGELDARGFRQWEEVGRHVVKGARAVYILAPMTRRIKEGDEEKVIILGFKTVPVFSIADTEGKELPTFDYVPLEMPPLYDVAVKLGVEIKWKPINGPALGWYASRRGEIVLGTKDAAVFFHELAHRAHDLLTPLKGGQDKEQETVAEFTAAVLSELYGHDHTGNAWDYIRSYNKSDPLAAIHKALSTVEKVLKLILGGNNEAVSSEPVMVGVGVEA